MHRQNVFVLALLVIVTMGVLTAGYATGQGPLGVLSAGIARFSKSNHNQLLAREALAADSKSHKAPEFAAGEWINSGPLTVEGLRGRVVLVEFWTFGCINCRNTLPAIKEWDARYRDQGLTVVGVHSPEFEEEKNVEHLRGEVTSLGIRYPVVTDNDYKTWKAYDVYAWPTTVILDKWGRIRWKRIGEGAYAETEQAIQTLLKEN